MKASELLNLTTEHELTHLTQGCKSNEVVTYHQSDRYPGWVWKKTVTESWLYHYDPEEGIDETTYRGIKEEWFGTKMGLSHAIQGWKYDDGVVIGYLCTRQMRHGRLGWDFISEYRSPFNGTMAECVKESERRTAYWTAQGSIDVHGDKLKLKMPVAA